MLHASAPSFVVAVALASALVAPAAAQTTFSDGDFAPANWDFVQIERGEGGSVSTEVVTDGNPGDALRISVTIDTAPGYSLIAGAWFLHDTYDPSVSGAIASVDYSEDTRAYQITGNGHATGIAIRQGDSIWVYRVDFTPEPAWTTKRAWSLVPSDFSRYEGTRPTLDFSGTAPPLQLGFYRANSHPDTGGGTGTRIADIDNWRVTLVPPCAVDADCDDGDACTVDTCVATVCERAPVDCDDGDGCTTDVCTDGTCSHPPLDCDDGRACTADACVNGFCSHLYASTFEVVDSEIESLLTRIESSPCGEEELVKKVVKKLRKKIAKARKRLLKADRTTRDQKVAKLIAKAETLLGKAQLYLGIAVDRGLISPACASTLTGLLTEVQICVGALPLPTV